MSNPWLYNSEPFTSDMVNDYVGFVYRITNKIDGKKYIGKKLFTMTKRKQVKKKSKRYKAVSNWEEYYGSSEYLQEDVTKLGHDSFERVIIRLCKSKSECSYYEAKFQFDENVLLTDSYNAWIMCRVRRSQLKGVQ